MASHWPCKESSPTAVHLYLYFLSIISPSSPSGCQAFLLAKESMSVQESPLPFPDSLFLIPWSWKPKQHTCQGCARVQMNKTRELSVWQLPPLRTPPPGVLGCLGSVGKWPRSKWGVLFTGNKVHHEQRPLQLTSTPLGCQGRPLILRATLFGPQPSGPACPSQVQSDKCPYFSLLFLIFP